MATVHCSAAESVSGRTSGSDIEKWLDALVKLKEACPEYWKSGAIVLHTNGVGTVTHLGLKWRESR